MRKLDRDNRKLARILVLVSLGMFVFGFALVPLYDVICEITGLNGKPGRADAQVAASERIDTTRWVTVEFDASVAQGLSWEFRPMVKKMRVNPGQTVNAAYYARNFTNASVSGQAVPSIAPGTAAAHFKKLECFCFSRQELKAGEGKEMPLRYVVQPDLPPGIDTITLSYTFFNADAPAAPGAGG